MNLIITFASLIHSCGECYILVCKSIASNIIDFCFFQEADTVEGALDIHLNKDGRIYKINNRRVGCSKINIFRIICSCFT